MVAPYDLVKNNRLQFGRWAVFLFYVLSLLLKNFNNKSAKAINAVIITNISVSVM